MGHPRISRVIAFVLLVVPSVWGMQLAARVDAVSASTRLISRAFDGGPALAGTGGEQSSISADGRYVAFLSRSANWGYDTGGYLQVFVKDRVTGVLHLASRNGVGESANADCTHAAISANGRYVAFSSFGTNLVAGGGLARHAYVHDLATGQTVLESVNSQEDPAWDSSGDLLAISGDGRFLVFDSYANNLVPNDTNSRRDIFVRDRVAGITERINVGPAGVEANESSGLDAVGISDDGRYVVFESYASNLVASDTNHFNDVFVRDRTAQTTERISQSAAGQGADDECRNPRISADGRYVTFQCYASNLIPGQDSAFNILMRDRTANTLFPVTVLPNGEPLRANHHLLGLSRNGRFVQFMSDAYELVPGDTNHTYDVFVRDLQSTVSVRANLTEGGQESESFNAGWGGGGISEDGRFVAFDSPARDLVAGDTNGRDDVFVRDLSLGTTSRVSVGPDGAQGVTGAESMGPVVSGDGRYVAFHSDAFNLVPGDTNGAVDVFVYDRVTDSLERASVSSQEEEGDPYDAHVHYFQEGVGISSDGRFVAFWSLATNLVPGDTNRSSDIFIRDRLLGTTERVSVNSQGTEALFGEYHPVSPAVSANGRYVAFTSPAPNLVPNDNNYTPDVFVRDRLLGVTERVSVATGGGENHGYPEFYSRPGISGDGRFVTFAIQSPDLLTGDPFAGAQVFVRDRLSAVTVRASVNSAGTAADGYSWLPYISGNGRWIAFSSWAENLVSPDVPHMEEIFLRDLQNQVTERGSLRSDGSPVQDLVRPAGLSADGRYLLFESWDWDVVSGDGNQSPDLFLRDRTLQTTQRVSLGADGQELEHGYFQGAALSGDGRYVAFSHNAGNLAAGDTNGTHDIFLRDLGGGPPLAPTGLTAQATSSNEIALHWTDNSTDETHFLVQRQEVKAGYLDRGTAPGNTPTFTDTALEPNSEYTYRVFAVNAEGRSEASNEVSVITPPLAPNAPQSFAVTALSDQEVRLTWNDASVNEDGFAVQRLIGGSFVEVHQAPANSTSWTDAGLQPRTQYTYRIRSFNMGGVSAWSASRSAVTLPSAVGRLGVPKMVNFGRVRLGSTAHRKLLLRNLDRRASLRVSLGTPDPPFAVNTKQRTWFLGPGQRVEVLLTFLAGSRGAALGTATVTSTDPRNKQVSIRLQGVGIRN